MEGSDIEIDDSFDIISQDFMNAKIQEKNMEIFSSPIKKKNSENILTLLDKEQVNDKDKDEIYYLLLDEIYDSITSEKELFENKSINVNRPVTSFKNGKTHWTNLNENCLQLNRDIQHLTKFIEKELGTKTSINGKLHLIMKGKIDTNSMCEAYKKYIKVYVQCSTCRTINTTITRNHSTRMDCITCLNTKCNATRVVTKIIKSNN